MPAVAAPHRRTAWLAVLALAFTLAACTTAPTPAPTPTATLAPSASPSPSPSPTASPTPEPTAAPTQAPVTACTIPHLSAAIVAGSVSNASGGEVGFFVTVKNIGPVACTFHQLDLVQMVDKNGVTMIAGPAPSPSAVLFLDLGGVLKTTIQAHNFCGGVPVEPVTVEFVLPAGVGTLKAKPLATSPGSIIPTCFQGGVPGSISMTEWGP